MANLKELRSERLRKLEELKKLGVDPYPVHSDRNHQLADIARDFTKLENESVTVAGRITSTRKIGKIAFLVIRDQSSKLQLFLSSGFTKKADPSNSELDFNQINLLDPGDFVEASGKVIKTQTGEISVDVSILRILAKSLRPLPNDRDGFLNKEERLRRRYVDLNVNQEVFQRFINRSNFWQSTRDFLIKQGFLEINIPVLEQTTGGADATPLVTHVDALDQDFYLRISHELPLKRLLGSGYEKVFDIGPRFRNENYSDEHLPEHVAMEWYWAYADWQAGMGLTEQLIRYVADATWSKRQFKLRSGQTVDLGKDGTHWPTVSFVEIIKSKYGLDVFDCSLAEAQVQLKKHKLEVEKHDNTARIIDKLWKNVRGEIAGPQFLIDVPAFLQPLAKTQPKDSRLSEQFNLVLGGTEVCKAYTELNDPLTQLKRFVEQQAIRDKGDSEAMMLDIDYIEMLEYGMPPACGFGYSERLFWTLEGVTAREGVPFPLLKRETDSTTVSLYPEAFKKKA